MSTDINRHSEVRGAAEESLMAMKSILDRSPDAMSNNDQQAFDRHQRKHDALVTEQREIEARTPSLRPAVHGTAARNLALGVGSHGSSDQSMTEHAAERRDSGDYTIQDAQEFSLGKAVRGMVTGNWQDSDLERRALAEGTDSLGGFLLPTLMSGQVVDRLRPKSQVIAAGAPVIAVDGHSLRIPKIGNGITAGWKTEGELVAESAPTFDAITLTPKTIAVNCRISRELFEDMSSLSLMAIENEILRSMATQIDAAALTGTGTAPQPAGLIANSSVTQVANGTNGTTASWAQATDAIKRLRTANVEPTALIWNPRTAATLGALTDSLGQPLRQPPYIDGVAQLDTTSVPVNATVGTSTDTSYIFAGDFKQLYVGTRLQNGFGIRLVNDQSRYVDNLQIALVAYARVDFGVAHNESFVIQKGIR